MSKETEALLRAILLQALRAKSLAEVIMAIKAMCSGDDIAAVEKAIADFEKENEKENG